jgi:hypothetical protein
VKKFWGMLTKVTKQGEKIYKAGRKSCKGKVLVTKTTFEWEIQTL